MIKNLHMIALIVFLAACSGNAPAATMTPTASPELTSAPLESITILPTETPLPYSTGMSPGVTYGPPSLTESIYVVESGGRGRNGLLSQVSMTEAYLVAYENAAYDGAAQSGFARAQTEFVYLYDQIHKQWNMVMKLTDGGYLWSQKTSDNTYSTFPLQIKIVPGGGKAWNTDYKLVPLPDSAEAEPFYTSGGYVELKGGTHVALGAEKYYTQWFNTVTGQWEAITEVQRALEASRPNVIFGLAATAEAVPDLGSMDKLIAAAKYFAAQPRVIASDQIAQMTVVEQPDVSEVVIFCNPGELKNCAILATARVGEHYYIIVQFGTKDGPKNLLLYLGGPMAGHDVSSARGLIERLNSYINGFTLEVITRIKVPNYDNPVVQDLTVGENDPLPESSVRLGEGEITDEQEITPMWVGIP